VLRIAGILSEQLAGERRALTAVKEAFALTANCYRAFAVKRMTVRCYATAAAAGVFVTASDAMKPAARINYLASPFFQLGQPVAVMTTSKKLGHFRAGHSFAFPSMLKVL